MNTYAILDRKRLGIELAEEELRFLIHGFLSGEVADYQITAFLMAVAIRGMSEQETETLTTLFLESGEQWNLHSSYEFVADKHSTGGVGDKVSIALAPLVASCGVQIAMLSGRGLGHTGGTLDKLEAIPGFNARVNKEQVEKYLDEVGCVIGTSTESIAPADRRIYALRDVTGTVESFPLITASIMSKKLALGASALLLDVKTGNGAFVKQVEQAQALARMLINAARGSGTRVSAMITDMSQPLGNTIGNALETGEAFDVLLDKAPEDLTRLTRLQAERILVASEKFDAASATEKIADAIRSGEAARHAERWITAQGGDSRVVQERDSMAQPSQVIDVTAQRDGFVSGFDTMGMGLFSIELGAGRKRQDDEIDYAAGIVLSKKIGDAVRKGETLARIHFGKRSPGLSDVQATFQDLVLISDDRQSPPPLIHDEIT